MQSMGTTIFQEHRLVWWACFLRGRGLPPRPKTGCPGGGFPEWRSCFRAGPAGLRFLGQNRGLFSFSLSISSPEPWLTRRHLFPPLGSARISPSHCSVTLRGSPSGACAGPPIWGPHLLAVRLLQGGAGGMGLCVQLGLFSLTVNPTLNRVSPVALPTTRGRKKYIPGFLASPWCSAPY